MAITVADLLVRFGADTVDLDRGFSSANQQIDTFTERNRSAFSTLQSIGGVALKGAAAGLAALGGGFVATAASGLGMNAQIENVTAQLNAFTKDGAKSAEILDMIRERAAKTPFEFDQMAAAAAGLLPAAKASGQGLESLIEKAEILAASNPAEGLEGAAFALREAVSGDFTSIIERFNLPRQFINQLKEEGVPALEIVQRAMQEMGFDTDLVSNLAETAAGRWSTLKDTFTNFAATITQPIFDRFSSGLGGVNTWLAANEPLLNQVATTIGTTLNGAIDGLIALLPPADVLLQNLTNGVSAVANGAGELWRWLTSLAAAIRPVVSLLFSLLSPVVSLIARFVNWKDVVMAVGVAIASVVLPAIASFVAAMAPVLATIALVVGAISLLRNAWESDFLGIATIVRSAVSSIVNTFGPLFSAIGAAIQVVSQYIETGELLSAAEFGVGESVAALADRFAEFGADVYDSMVAMWAAVQPVLSAFGEWLSTAIPAAMDNVLLSVGNLTASLAPVVQWVGSVVAAFANYRDAVLDAGFGSIESQESIGLFPAVLQPVVGWIDRLIGALGGAASVLTTFISTGELLSASEFVSSDTVAALADTFVNFSLSVYDSMVALWSGVQPILSNLYEWLQGVLPQALSFLSAVWGNIWSVLPGIVSGAWSAIQSVAGVIVEWLRTNIPVALGVLSSVWSNVWGALPGIVSGAWSAIQSVLGALVSWFENAPVTMEGLRAAWQSVWASLSSSVESAREQIGAAWSVIADLFGPAVERMRGGFSRMLADMGSLSPKFDELVAAFSNFGSAIQPILSLLGQGIQQMATTIGGTLVVVSLTATNLIASAFGRMVDIVGIALDTWTGMINGIADVVRGVVALVQAIFAGDWAAAWGAAGQIVQGFITTVTAQLNGLVRTSAAVWGLIADTVRNTLSDLGLDMDSLSISIDAADLISWVFPSPTELLAWKFPSPLTLLSWVFPLPTALLSWIFPSPSELIDWKFPSPTALLTWFFPAPTMLLAWAFPSPTALLNWKFPSPSELLEWVFPSPLALLSWVFPSPTALLTWVWPGLPSWSWPEIPTPGWLTSLLNWSPSLPSWLGGGGGGDESSSSSSSSSGDGKSNGDGRSNRGGGSLADALGLQSFVETNRPLAPVNLGLFGMENFPRVTDSSLEFGGAGPTLTNRVVPRDPGNSRLNIDDLAEAIVRALRAEPMRVELNFAATIANDGDAERLSYQVARRISDAIQRRSV